MPRHEHVSKELQVLDSGLRVLLETPEFDLISAGNLVDRFYSDFDVDDDLTLKPLGMVLNPEVRGGRVFRYDNVWVVIYRRGYRVHIIHHYGTRNTSGPHTARLMYQSQQQPDQMYWLASTQFTECMFFSEARLLDCLAQAIKTQTYYISDKSRKDKMIK